MRQKREAEEARGRPLAADAGFAGVGREGCPEKAAGMEVRATGSATARPTEALGRRGLVGEPGVLPR
jgi:hypothetical protein